MENQIHRNAETNRGKLEMRYYLNWRYWLRRLTIKDAIIASFVMVVGFQWAFISQNETVINKLNEENERLELQNERLGHLLDISIEALRRANGKQYSEEGKENREAKLRDPFRPDHPTRDEVREEARGE